LDGSAKSSLIDAYLAQRDALKRFLTARLRSESTAEDILQDMYLKLERAEISAPVENMSAFLYRTANNLAFDHRKANARRKVRDEAWSEGTVTMAGIEAIHDAPDAEESLDARRMLKKVMAAAEELPPQCRQVFKACKLKGMTYKDAAAHFGVSTGTIEKHVSKALKHLVQVYREDGG